MGVSMEWQPLGDRIIVRKLEDDDKVTTSGIHVVSHEKNEKNKKAVVVAAGPGKYSGAHRVPMTIKVGDTVLYNGMYGTDIGDFTLRDDDKLMILHEEDVIAVVEDE
jgi:chaperonin GroES